MNNILGIKQVVILLILIATVSIVIGFVLFGTRIHLGPIQIGTPSLEEVAQRDNVAVLKKSYDILWDDMHPEDKARWGDRKAYLDSVRNALSTSDYTDIKVKEITNIPSWTHPIIGKQFVNVKEVVSSYTLKDIEEPVDSPYIYTQGEDGNWYFFSQTFSPSDRESIKSEAAAGPEFTALVKSPDKYRGQKVRYTGYVEQIQEGNNGSGFLRLSVTDLGSGFWKDELYVAYSAPTDAVQGDIVTVYGIISGAVTYTSQANYQITLPGMEAAFIEKSATAKAE